MPISTPFITPVNASGLPIALGPKKSLTGLENICGLDAATLCRWYWKCHNITFELEIMLGQETLKRSFVAHCPLEPIERIARYPQVVSHGVDALNLQHHFLLELSHVTLNSNNTHNLTLQFNYTNNKTLYLSLHPLEDDYLKQHSLRCTQTVPVSLDQWRLTGYLYLYHGKKKMIGGYVKSWRGFCSFI